MTKVQAPGIHDMNEPRRVFLFSGHMIDAPDRPRPRFPPAAEPRVRDALAALLGGLGMGTDDLAVCSGACGGDLLFAERAAALGARLEIYLPFAPDAFRRASIEVAGADWPARFDAACARADVHLMPLELAPSDDDPFERTNLWMLDAASRFGADKLDFVCLWNGEGGDGPGGTQHLMDAVTARHGRVHRIDPAVLRPD